MIYNMQKLFYFNMFCLGAVKLTTSRKASTLNYMRRQGNTPPVTHGQLEDEMQIPQMIVTQEPPAKGGGAHLEKERFTTPTTTQKRFVRTTPMRISFHENCDYLAHYCLKAYDTGKLCGRTLYYTYHTFKNYCLLDYVNCMERYEVWQVVHMGECFNVTVLTEYLLYPYDDDYFLDQYYILEDH